jgi:outer membrane protein assembly factor BamD
MLRYLSIFLLVFLVFSCSGKTSVKPREKFDAAKSFEKANKLLDEEEFEKARSILLEIKNRDLSKKYAPLAQLRIADSYVKEEEFDRAVAEYRRFLEIYPDHRHAPYAQYQVAMVFFNQIESPERGYSGAARALSEFERLKKEYPRNPYKDVIELRIKKCLDVMANYEFLVGKFYQKKGSFDAAIRRYEYLIEKFPDYDSIDQVLFNLGLSYKNAKQPDKATEYLGSLVEKYPDSPLVKKAKKELSSLKEEKK